MISPYNLNPYFKRSSSVAPYVKTKYIQFNGVNGYIAIGTPLSVSGAFSISMWLNTTDVTNARLFGNDANDEVYIYNNTTIRWRANASNKNLAINTEVLSIGIDYHLVIVRNSSNQTYIYLNGVKQSDLDVVADNMVISTIGATVGVSYNNYNCGQFAVYSKEISQEEVNMLKGGATPNLAGNPMLITDCMLAYDFEGVTAFPVIPDISANGNNGTATNMEEADIKTY